MDVFQKKSTSKDRLKGSSIQLVKEDQYRKKMKKNYPKLLTSLSDMVKRYEVDFQETFLVRLSDAQQCRGKKKNQRCTNHLIVFALVLSGGWPASSPPTHERDRSQGGHAVVSDAHRARRGTSAQRQQANTLEGRTGGRVHTHRHAQPVQNVRLRQGPNTEAWHSY